MSGDHCLLPEWEQEGEGLSAGWGHPALCPDLLAQLAPAVLSAHGSPGRQQHPLPCSDRVAEAHCVVSFQPAYFLYFKHV